METYNVNEDGKLKKLSFWEKIKEGAKNHKDEIMVYSFYGAIVIGGALVGHGLYKAQVEQINAQKEAANAAKTPEYWKSQALDYQTLADYSKKMEEFYSTNNTVEEVV